MSPELLAQRASVRLALLGIASRTPLRVVTEATAPERSDDGAELLILDGGETVAERASALAQARGAGAGVIAIAVSSSCAIGLARLRDGVEAATGAGAAWRAAHGWARAAPDEPDAPTLEATDLAAAAAALASLGFTCVEPEAALVVPELKALRSLGVGPLARVTIQTQVLGERHRPVLFVRAAAAKRARTRAEALGEPWTVSRRAPTDAGPPPRDMTDATHLVARRPAEPLAFADLLREARDTLLRVDPRFRVSGSDANAARAALARDYFLNEIELIAHPPRA